MVTQSVSELVVRRPNGKRFEGASWGKFVAYAFGPVWEEREVRLLLGSNL